MRIASLKFNALVVKHLSVDILAGTSFHKENDVYSRMSKGTIHIGDNIVVQSSPPALLTLHEPQQAKHAMVQIKKAVTVLPGDTLSFEAPQEMRPDEFVMIEPNTRQCKPFFKPSIIQLQDGHFEVQNELEDPILLKKNNQAVIMHSTKEVPKKVSHVPSPVNNICTEKTLQEVLKEVNIDGNLPKREKEKFNASISQNLPVFQQNLPGYNGAYGPVFASFRFASKARPIPQKLRMPNYGSIQDSLFNAKCQELEKSGVIIDPLANHIQPAMTHNAWVVKKPSSANKPWEQCKSNDVRLVVGLDPLNKY